MLPLLLTLPRFLAPRPLFDSFRSLSKAPGVEEVIGEPTTEGLGAADGNLPDEGVLKGPNFGVLRADIRGVSSADVEGGSWVTI